MKIRTRPHLQKCKTIQMTAIGSKFWQRRVKVIEIMIEVSNCRTRAGGAREYWKCINLALKTKYEKKIDYRRTNKVSERCD